MVAADTWNAMVPQTYPFLRHEFFLALEQSACVGEDSGWKVQHLVMLQDSSNDHFSIEASTGAATAAASYSEQVLAVMPLYQKRHSRGEFVFDYDWANAYEHHGLAYYPKWLTAIPFTPCAGPRLLLRDQRQSQQVLEHFLHFLQGEAEEQGVSSWHCLFPNEESVASFEQMGCLIRQGVQFQWRNNNYKNFDDYLATFSSKKRKNVKRERRRMREQGIRLVRKTGVEITSQDWLAFFQFYQVTYLKHGMRPYLNEAFFRQIAETMPEQLMLVCALKDDLYVGAALSFIGSDTLYGRYWGCLEEYNNLHFEACYYQGLDYCIEQGLQRFDSGAQGEHKISRGFEPITTYSAHWVRHPQFSEAIAEFLDREKLGIERYKADAESYLPFKQMEDETQ